MFSEFISNGPKQQNQIKGFAVIISTHSLFKNIALMPHTKCHNHRHMLGDISLTDYQTYVF